MTARTPMPRRGLIRRLHRLWRREDGTATIEFVMCVPLVIMLFMASMESGLFMIRHVMMERALDIVMRDFRLGRLNPLSHNQIRDRVCAASPMEMNCATKTKVWMDPVNPAAWTNPAIPAYCGDKGGTVVPPLRVSSPAASRTR